MKFDCQLKLEHFIFASRWLQAPLYIGLVVVQGIYLVQFLKELYHLCTHFPSLDPTDIMIAVLDMIDVVMIANLITMVIIGGYVIFVSKINGIDHHPDKPEWLSHINAGVLKIKLGTSLIGITSIYLLRDFVSAADITNRVLLWQVAIHIVFLISAFMLTLTEKVMNQAIKLDVKHTVLPKD